MTEKKTEIVDLTKPKGTRIVVVDCGTMNLVMAEPKGKKAEFSSIRNMYLPLDKSQITMAELSNIDYVETEDSVYIIGEDAFNFSNIFGKTAKRPMSKGLISPSEVDSLDILELILRKLAGTTTNGHCIYSVPAPSIDSTNNITYHEGVFKRIFQDLGYQAQSFNEAMALIYSNCQEDQFTGLAFSFGAGMVNCFHGDTKIRLLDGTTPTFKELVKDRSDDTFWVYSKDNNDNIVPGLAHSPRITKHVNQLCVITLDNDKVIKCSMEHPFRLPDGSYTRADELHIGDSLSPLYTKNSEKGLVGYEMLYQNNKGWTYTHRMVSKYFNGDVIHRPNVIHHWDYNKLNNDPDNLKIMHRDDHIALHGRSADYIIENVLGKTYDEIYGCERSKEVRLKQSEAMKEIYNTNPDIFKNSLEAFDVWNELIKGLDFDDIYGVEQSAIIRSKMSDARIGKTYQDIYGKLYNEIIDKRREQCTIQCANNTFGYNCLSNDAKSKCAKSQFKKGDAPWNKDLSYDEYTKYLDIEKISNTSKKQWSNQDSIDKMMFGKGISIAKECISKYDDLNEDLYESVRCTKKKKNWAPISYNKWISYYKGINIIDDVLNWNHNILDIEVINEECDVYDITVDEFHNFALDAGVFVHNCALSFKSVPIITFSVARSGDWIDENVALSMGTVPNRITAIKENNTDLQNYSIGNKKERRIREAIVYYYKEMIRYSLDQIKSKLIDVSDSLQLPESLSVIVAGGTSMATGFIPLFEEVLNEYKDDFGFDIKEVKHADDPLTSVAEGLLIKAMSEFGDKK
jgi:hypothetical protein